jgi:hypothetical protein
MSRKEFLMGVAIAVFLLVVLTQKAAKAMPLHLQSLKMI